MVTSTRIVCWLGVVPLCLLTTVCTAPPGAEKEPWAPTSEQVRELGRLPAVKQAIDSVARRRSKIFAESVEVHIATSRNARMALRSWLSSGSHDLPVILGATFYELDRSPDKLTLHVLAIDEQRKLASIKVAARSKDGRGVEIQWSLLRDSDVLPNLSAFYELTIPVEFVAFDQAIVSAEWDEKERILVLRRSGPRAQARVQIPNFATCQIAVAVERLDGRSSNYIPAFWIRSPTSRPVGG